MPHFTDISMKNFSTVGARIAVVTLFAGLVTGAAQAAPRTCEFRANAPDQHTVVKRDTLWDISGKFLEHPWCWPQVWGLNKQEIRDPHWIYPGQIIYFDRVNKRLSLSPPGSGGNGVGASGVTRLSPQVRTEGMGSDAIHSIPASVIEPFLSQPLVVEADELAGSPRIVAAQEGRVYLGKDDKVYVRGPLKGVSNFHVFRPGNPLKDPVTHKVIAYEAVFLGGVRLFAEAKPGSDVHTFIVNSAKQEMGVGDLLIPVAAEPLRNYMPHPPETPVSANVVGIYSGVTYAGQNQVISINRGSLDGIDVGTVLEIYNLGETIQDKTEAKKGFGLGKTMIKLPDETSGTLFIFRVFNRISYGLIMQVTDPVEVGDVARSPE